MREKICFGGTFDPIHHGHLLCARAAAEAMGAKTVVIIPAGMPIHRAGKGVVSNAEDRLEMCRLAVKGVAGFEVDDRECRRAGPTYTIDTARELKKEGWSEVVWLIGADMVGTLSKWHEAEALGNEVKFAVMARGGVEFEWEKVPAQWRGLQKSVVMVPRIEISGTEIRRRVGLGLSIEYLCPKGVCRYIGERGLYGAGAKTRGAAHRR